MIRQDSAGRDAPDFADPAVPALAPAVQAEVDRLRAHARICLSCSTCEAMSAFWALDILLEGHAVAHQCPLPGSPHAQHLYGAGLPYGPNCPTLSRVAAELGLDGARR